MRNIDELIDRLCDDYLEQLIDEDRRTRHEARPPIDIGPDGEPIELHVGFEAAHWFSGLAQDENERMQDGDRSSVEEPAQELLKKAAVELERTDRERLLYELQRTLLRAYRMLADEWERDFSGRERTWRAGHRGQMSPTPAVDQQSAPRAQQRKLSDLIQAFVEDRDGKTWTPKTGTMIKSALKMFLEIVGDRPLAEMNAEVIREYRLTLEKLPPRTNLLYRDRTISEVVALNADGPKLSATTIGKWMGHVSSMFILGERLGWVDRNPAVRMAPSTSRREEREERQPFTDDDLRAIFSKEYQEATLGENKFAKYWIPLLCCFTGARLDEMAQLRVADIAEVDGLPVIEIREGEGQSLKTAGSARTVPMHSGLVELGFLEYVEAMKKKRQERLFTELRRDPKGLSGYGYTVSKWFGPWLRTQAKITDKRKVLHSFRHTVATRLKHADVQDHVIAELLGHENENITTGRYGKKLDVRKLAEAVEKLDFRDSLAALVVRGDSGGDETPRR